MNNKQTHLIHETSKSIATANSKVNEFTSKFLQDTLGVLGVNNHHKNKTLSIGVYRGNVGQTIEIDNQLEPLVLEMVKKMQYFYSNSIQEMSEEDFIRRLIECRVPKKEGKSFCKHIHPNGENALSMLPKESISDTFYAVCSVCNNIKGKIYYKNHVESLKEFNSTSPIVYEVLGESYYECQHQAKDGSNTLIPIMPHELRSDIGYSKCSICSAVKSISQYHDHVLKIEGEKHE